MIIKFYMNKYIFIYFKEFYFQLRRFENKRKAPTPRSKPIKISKKDVNLAAESLLDLGNDIPQPNIISGNEPDFEVHICN